uniref:Uncharacterized protein n=1 Tax=Euphorbia ebracteolata waikavirus TaxID=3115786 RepID=A0AAT9JBB3_9SECO
MLRALLVIGLSVNMLSLFLVSLGVVLKIVVLILTGIFVIMLSIFLNVLALVIRPEENLSQLVHRGVSGTPLARYAAPAANFPPPRR